MLKFEYKALNLMDQVCTVEVAFDSSKHTVHVYDRDAAAYPMYDFSQKQFVASDEFITMQKVFEKKFLFEQNGLESEKRNYRWVFYTPKKEILMYESEKLNGPIERISIIESLLMQEYLEKIQNRTNDFF